MASPFQKEVEPSGPRRPGVVKPAKANSKLPKVQKKTEKVNKADKPGFVEKYLPTFSRQGAKAAKAGKPLPGAPKPTGKKTNLNTSGKIAKPKLPIVNLLPPRLELAKVRRSTRRGFVITGIIIIVSAGLVYLGQQGLSLSALNDLSSANSGLTQANASLAKYNTVRNYYAAITARQQAVIKAQGNVINYQAVYNEIFKLIPAGGSISDITVTNISAPTATGASSSTGNLCGIKADPLAPTNTTTAIGCLTFTGNVSNRGDIATLGIALKNSSLLSNSTVVQVQGNSLGSTGGSFKGAAVVTVAAASSK